MKKLLNIEKEDISIENLIANSKKEFVGTKLTLDFKDYMDKILEEKEVPEPEVVMENDAFKKMMALVNSSDKELAWHGLVKKTSHRYEIYDIIVYPQTVTGTTVDADEDLYANWTTTLEDEPFNDMRMQGHSHVNMACFPSGTDQSYYEEMLLNIEDYYIFIIANKKRTFWVSVVDVKNNLVFEEITLKVKGLEPTFEDWAKEQTEKYIKPKSYSYNRPDYDSLSYPGYYQKSVTPTQKELVELEELEELEELFKESEQDARFDFYDGSELIVYFDKVSREVISEEKLTMTDIKQTNRYIKIGVFKNELPETKKSKWDTYKITNKEATDMPYDFFIARKTYATDLLYWVFEPYIASKYEYATTGNWLRADKFLVLNTNAGRFTRVGKDIAKRQHTSVIIEEV